MTTDGPAALRMLAGDFELTKAACWNEGDTASMWTLAAAWQAERERNIRTDWRRCPDCGLDWPHPSETSSFVCPSCRAASDRAALAGDRDKWSFDTLLHVGRMLLKIVYPDDIFTGSSGDPGPTYVVALRDALKAYAGQEADRAALERARALINKWLEYSRTKLTDEATAFEICAGELIDALGSNYGTE